MDQEREDQLASRQDGRLYPLGRALRSTYDAENHDSLGSDVTGLMIDLSKVPYDDDDYPVVPRPAEAPVPLRSWVSRIGDLFGRRG